MLMTNISTCFMIKTPQYNNNMLVILQSKDKNTTYLLTLFISINFLYIFVAEKNIIQNYKVTIPYILEKQ